MAKKFFGLLGKEDPPPAHYLSHEIQNQERVFGEPLSSGGDTSFRALDSVGVGRVKVPDVVQACIRQIIGRAAQAELRVKSRKSDRSTKAGLLVHRDYVPRDFWVSVFETYLTSGNVLLFRAENGELYFSGAGITTAPEDASGLPAVGGSPFVGMSGQKTVWSCNVYFPSTSAMQTVTIPYEKGSMARWDSSQGVSIRGQSPLELVAPAVSAYKEALELLYSYGKRGHKIGRVVKQSGQRTDPQEVRRYLKVFDGLMRKPGNFITTFTEHGFDVENFPNSGAPALREALDQAVVAVCRVYGVPTELVISQIQGDRRQPHEVEDSLLRCAVEPMLDAVAAAVSRVMGMELEFDISKLGRPGFDGMADKAMQLGQSGTIKIDEIRALLGFPPLPNGEGDKLPETAGAGYRDDTSGKSAADKPKEAK